MSAPPNEEPQHDTVTLFKIAMHHLISEVGKVPPSHVCRLALINREASSTFGLPIQVVRTDIFRRLNLLFMVGCYGTPREPGKEIFLQEPNEVSYDDFLHFLKEASKLQDDGANVTMVLSFITKINDEYGELPHDIKDVDFTATKGPKTLEKGRGITVTYSTDGKRMRRRIGFISVLNIHSDKEVIDLKKWANELEGLLNNEKVANELINKLGGGGRRKQNRNIPSVVRKALGVPSNMPYEDAIASMLKNTTKQRLAALAKVSPTTNATKSQLLDVIIQSHKKNRDSVQKIPDKIKRKR